MIVAPPARESRKKSTYGGGVLLLLLVFVSSVPSPAQQALRSSNTMPGESRFQVAHARQPEANTLPPPGREQLPSFVQSLSAKNGQFEVIVGQGRLITLTDDLSVPGRPSPVVAVSDPTVVDFDIVGPRHIRVNGQRIGATDLSIITADRESLTLEVLVVPDLDVLRARIRAAFPDAQVELAALRQNIIVEGQARDPRQVAQIIQLLESYLEAIQPLRTTAGGQRAGAGAGPPSEPLLPPDDPDLDDPDAPPPEVETLPEGARPPPRLQPIPTQIINLLRIPGPQQVVLKVQVAELNRTALRQFGTSLLVQNGTGALGSTVGPPYSPVGDGGSGLLGLLNPVAGTTSSVFGILDSGNVNLLINALRQNQVLTILAEPNLVAMHGQEASFLAGGEFPVPVPQPGGGVGLVTIEYRSFGVGLTFVPYILDDETIRLSVSPEVSSIDFSAGIVIQGTAVPGLSTRRTNTVVQLGEGQTLAISGILQVELEGNTTRVPGLGDIPYIGALFRNTTSQTVEKELVVLVTPHLVEAMHHDQVPMLPGEDVLEPDDHELFVRGRIERRSWQPYRATASWDDPLGVEHQRQLESQFIYGPHGYSD
jgi:pilus assembly protein CpaC